MKSIIKLIYIFLIGCYITSCNDLLDIKPSTFVSDDLIWQDKKQIDQFVANTYGSLVCGFNRNTQGYDQDWSAAFGGNFDAGADDFDGKFDANVNWFNTGQITSQSVPFAEQIWFSNYDIIRKCNILIEGIPKVEDRVLSPELKLYYIAEAHFIRAFCYFDLAKTFGKAPLIEHAQQLDEDLLVYPTNFDGLINFIVNECDLFSNNLEIPFTNEMKGHATKGAFLALKSRALLYWASPLNNPNNDISRWEKAATAAYDVIKLNIYHLYKNGETPYYSLFFDKTDSNSEIIFERRFQFPEITHCIHMQWSLDPADADRGSWNGLYPTQNLVDAYETTDGKLISDPTSIYNPQDPYANRDSRFYQTLLYHGSRWEGNTLWMHTNTVDPQQSGSCQPGPYRARCGYGLRKMMVEYMGAAGDLYSTAYAQDNNWPYFRYAEILLNYAEARNEYLDAPDTEVYNAINEVRDRAKQPALPANLSKEEMRLRIRNERRVELCLEEHRFFDLRRWKDAETLRAPIKGMEIDWDGKNNYYKIVTIEERFFDEKHYYLPIPFSETERNPNLLN